MPRPLKPNISDVMKRPDAWRVVDVHGRLFRQGPHIHPRPTFFRKNADGTSTEVVVDMTQPVEGLVGATSDITPPLPPDIGPTLDVAANPLWSDPTVSDVYQGQFPDCYFIAVIDSISAENPGYIRSPDIMGKWYVTFRRNLSAPQRVITDSRIAASGSGLNPTTKACALGVFERAWAYYRRGTNKYADIGWGSPTEVMTALGMGSVGVYPNAGASAQTALMAAVATNQALGACSFPTPSSNKVIGSHCYRLVNVWTENGVMYVMLRNPWGIDGAVASGDPADAMITVTWAEFVGSFSYVGVSTKYAADVKLWTPPAPPIIPIPDPMPPAVPVSPAPTPEPVMPTAKITPSRLTAKAWDRVDFTITGTNGTPNVVMVPAHSNTTSDINYTTGKGWFVMPTLDSTVTLTVTAPDGQTATDSFTVKLITDAPPVSPPSTPTTPAKDRIVSVLGSFDRIGDVTAVTIRRESGKTETIV